MGMKTLFLLPLFILKGSALEGQMPQTNGGLCLDPQMMSAVCTINTQIGTTMEEAHLKCAAAAQVEERKKKNKKNKKKNKGKNKGKVRNVMWILMFLMSSLPVFGRR